MRWARMNSRGSFVVVTLLALLGPGCAAPLPEPHQSVAVRDPNEVRAAAILEVYRQATAERSDAPDLCVGVEPGVDLSKVLKAVAGRGPRIWAVDRCTLREGGIVEALSGRPAIAVRVESVEVADSGVAHANAGWMYGTLAGEGRDIYAGIPARRLGCRDIAAHLGQLTQWADSNKMQPTRSGHSRWRPSQLILVVGRAWEHSADASSWT